MASKDFVRRRVPTTIRSRTMRDRSILSASVRSK
jgi:hypothetical protein